MHKSLMALGWLRDLTIVVLCLAGNHIRHTSPAVGVLIILAAAVVFLERFLWSWYLADLSDKQNHVSLSQ